MHLIAWDKVMNAKKQGGLGFKNLWRQNKAFIMKICWNLLMKKDSLWAQCIWSKYNCGHSTVPKVSKKRNSSSVWKAVVGVWDKFFVGIGWKDNNGNDTKFWQDLWLPLDRPLITFVQDHSLINVDDTVRDHILGNGRWNTNGWWGILPLSIINSISRMSIPFNHFPDCFTWRAAKDGCFTVKSAYTYLSGHVQMDTNRFWSHLWKWQVPDKIKMFMWQVGHERLVTNSLRARRGLTDGNLVPFTALLRKM